MKAAVCYEFGKPIVIEDIEIDPPQVGEVNVMLAACFPGRELRQVPALDILRGGGGIHSITQQQPSAAAEGEGEAEGEASPD